MQNFSPIKPRTPGTIWSAISRAMDQVGGADAMAAHVERKTWWAYTVSDEDAASNARTNLSFADACTLAEKGGVALAEHIALKAGGVFVPAGVIDERIDPEKMLTPPQLDPEKLNVVRGGGGWDHKRREIEERVFGIHLMICGVDAPTETERRALPRLPANHPAMRAIHALVEIAGKGANLGDMTTSGSVKARIREDLIFALDACAIAFGLE